MALHLEWLTEFCQTHVIPPEDDDDNVSLQPEDQVQQPFKEDKNEASQAEMPQTPQTQEIEVPESSLNVIPGDKVPKSMEPQDEPLRWHYRLGHLPFTRMKEMMNQGTLPRRLLKVDTPFYATCQYGKMTRRTWRVKGDAQHKTKIATQPGQVVSVAQLESPTLGFVAQLKGILTNQRYKYALVFVDQYSNLTFVFLQRRSTSEETVLAKKTFERYASLKGVRIQHYHADNSCFADEDFVTTVKRRIKFSLTVELMPTFKMEWQRRRSGTSRKRQELVCSMP